MDELALRITQYFYFGILCLSILIAAFQYATERTTALRSALFYWFGLIISIVANSFVTEVGFLLVSVAGLGTFITQIFLGSFFAETNGLELNHKRLLVFYLGTVLLGFLLYISGLRFEIYSFPILVGCTWPVPASLLLVYRRKARPLSLVQKIFAVAAILMSIHYLDWGYFRVRPNLYLLAFSVAVALLYTQATLIPMMSNEMILRHRNDLLEDEVKAKVAQLTETEKQLWEANKLASLGRMAGGMAHELNTPLQVIELQTEDLRDLIQQTHVPQSNVFAEGLARIQYTVEKIAKITEALRQVARDGVIQNIQTLDLRELVQEAACRFHDKVKDLGITMNVELPNEPLTIACNRLKILRVLASLIENALQAISTLDQKKVIVRGLKLEKTVQVSIQDSGRIDPKIIPKLMEPFFTTKPVGEGMGLGLSTSRSIIESHGGSLRFDINSPTTRFVIELPGSS